MTSLSLPLLGVTLALTVWLGALPAQAGQVSVLSVGDGDTLTLTEGGQRVKVRLACIDAPETAQRPYGSEARKALQALAPVGSTVQLRTVATDRYGRTVAEVSRAGTNVNLALVKGGYAFAYRAYLQNCDRERYLGAEREAEGKRLGVWSVPGGVTRPWDWRHGTGGGRSQTNRFTPGASGGRYTCKRIGNWARAQELLKQGHTYLDRDGDGEACESLR